MQLLSRKALACVAVGSTLLLGACSVPELPNGDEPATPTTEAVAAAATPTGATPLKIVTPTPFVAGATTTAGQTPTVPEENPAVYIVQENDTLYGVAVRFDVELDALIALNGLSDPNDIWIGQELKIPAD
ncbi:MAG TPA: LysM domain-containing protein [Thermomicrobiales bacterium]|nr:LysM domain-containing protein [Thermomicrobiales bacterium]